MALEYLFTIVELIGGVILEESVVASIRKNCDSRYIYVLEECLSQFQVCGCQSAFAIVATIDVIQGTCMYERCVCHRFKFANCKSALQ